MARDSCVPMCHKTFLGAKIHYRIPGVVVYDLLLAKNDPRSQWQHLPWDDSETMFFVWVELAYSDLRLI